MDAGEIYQFCFCCKFRYRWNIQDSWMVMIAAVADLVEPTIMVVTLLNQFTEKRYCRFGTRYLWFIHTLYSPRTGELSILVRVEQNWSNILLLADCLVMGLFPIIAPRNANVLPLILQAVPFATMNMSGIFFPSPCTKL